MESYNSPNAQKIEQLRNCITRWQDYLLQAARGNTGQAAQALNDLVQLSNRLPLILHDHLSNLLDDLSNRDDQAVRSCLAGLVKKLVILIESARGPADFDALQAELARPLQIDGVMVHIGIGYHANELRLLRLYVTRWQDYFSQLEAGHEENADNLLYFLAGTMSYDGLYPSAKILARLSPAGANPAGLRPGQRPELIPPEELTIDNVDQMFILINRLERNGNRMQPGLEDLGNRVGELRVELAQLATGAAIKVIHDSMEPPRGWGRVGYYAPPLTDIKKENFRRAFIHYLEAPDALPPRRNETFDSYTTRLVDYGKEQRDWPLVYRALLARRDILQDNSPELRALKLFTAGLQQESVGLWAKAVCSYFAAVNARSHLLPRDDIIKSLGRLKEMHPEEFARTPYTSIIYSSLPGWVTLGDVAELEAQVLRSEADRPAPPSKAQPQH